MTTGHLIHWASLYDPTVQILTLGRAGRLRQKTLDLAKLTPGDAVLDIGCGTGDLTLIAARTAARVAGIDGSPEMIAAATKRAARKHLAIDFRVAYVEALPYPDETFDVVLSSLMVHHLPGELKDRAFREAARVLRPGGRLVIADVTRAEHGGPLGHLSALMHPPVRTAVNELGARVKDAGFEAVETGRLGIGPVGFVCARKPPFRSAYAQLPQ